MTLPASILVVLGLGKAAPKSKLGGNEVDILYDINTTIFIDMGGMVKIGPDKVL